jgi:hypothetical protein
VGANIRHGNVGSLAHYEYETSAMMPLMQTQTHKSNNASYKNFIGGGNDSDPDTQNFNHYYTFSNINISNPWLPSTVFDMTVKNDIQLSPNSFSTNLNPNFHPQNMNNYHGT